MPSVNAPTYRLDESFTTNLELGPRFDASIPTERFSHPCQFLGLDLNTPFGVGAGLLLDSEWIRLYAQLGFDILTYKSVRTRAYPCHPAPNLCQLVLEATLSSLPPDTVLTGYIDAQHTSPQRISAANSYGMPSLAPQEWIADMQRARTYLQNGQILIASTVGTPEPNGTQQDLADDYALCAEMALQGGAMVVEANFSCPNVTSEEGSIYRDPIAAGQIAATIRRRIGDAPLLIKIGHFDDQETMSRVMEAISPHIDGVTAINAIGMPIIDPTGQARFPGRETGGVGGWGIRQQGLETAEALAKVREQHGLDYRIVGVGGVTEPEAVQQYLDAGADVAEAVTATVWNPYLAQEVGKALWQVG